MLYNMPERRSEPFEKWTKVPTCPVCGEPIDWESLPLHYVGDPHLVQRTDIVSCAKCDLTVNDLGEALELLED